MTLKSSRSPIWSHCLHLLKPIGTCQFAILPSVCYNEIQEMTMKPAKTKKTHKGERTKVLLPSVSKLSKWHFKKGCCAWLMVPPRGWFHSRGVQEGCLLRDLETLGGGSLKFHLFLTRERKKILSNPPPQHDK